MDFHPVRQGREQDVLLNWRMSYGYYNQTCYSFFAQKVCKLQNWEVSLFSGYKFVVAYKYKHYKL